MTARRMEENEEGPRSRLHSAPAHPLLLDKAMRRHTSAGATAIRALVCAQQSAAITPKWPKHAAADQRGAPSCLRRLHYAGRKPPPGDAGRGGQQLRRAQNTSWRAQKRLPHSYPRGNREWQRLVPRRTVVYSAAAPPRGSHASRLQSPRCANRGSGGGREAP